MANSYLNKTMGSGNRKTWTWSAWVKRSKLGVEQNLWGVYVHAADNMRLFFQSNDVLEFKFYNNTSYKVETSRVFRDTNAWYHIVCVADTSNSTEADRLQLWVNGERQSGGGTQPTLNLQMSVNDSNTFEIGRYNGGGYFDGYMSHVSFVDGTALTPTSFGQTDSTSGIWKFKSPSGLSWGTNGFHLKMENSANLGLDSSGQTNNYTVNGNLKQALDTPSNVHATLNPLSGADTMADDSTFSNGNNTVVCSGSVYNVFGSTIGVNKGKWYAEFKTNVAPGDGMIGIFAKLGASGNYLGSQTHQYSWYNASGGKFASNSSNLATSVGTYTTNDIIGIALDCDNNKLYYHKNGTYMTYGGGTMNPTSGTYGISITDPDDTDLGFYFMSAMDWGGSTRGNWSANFGNGFFGTTAVTSNSGAGEQDDAGEGKFQYDVPAGYYALNTKNINTYG